MNSAMIVSGVAKGGGRGDRPSPPPMVSKTVIEKQGRINHGALGARTPGPPTLRGPPQERSCFENNESKFGEITTSIIACESKYFFMCRTQSLFSGWAREIGSARRVEFHVPPQQFKRRL